MQIAKKTNFFKELKTDYKQTKKPILLQTTPGQYLSIDGHGKPADDLFQRSVAALYSTAFTIKMTRKAEGKEDYVVCKLEALWWADGDLKQVGQENWQWKLMIRTPGTIAQQDLEMACQALLSKGKAVEVEQVRLENIDEGLAVQVLHIGPYDQEEQTLTLVEQFMRDNNLWSNGHHHEIYISDPRRIEPEKLKTILRQPVQRSV